MAVQGLKAALEETLLLTNAMHGEEICLTKEERTCLINIARMLDTDKINSYHNLLWKICKDYEKENMIGQNISMYEFIMSHIASVLGNERKYDESNAISRIIIQENAFVRRFGNIAESTYNMAYNYNMQNPTDYNNKIWRTMVKRNALLFHIEKDFNLEKVLNDKLSTN